MIYEPSFEGLTSTPKSTGLRTTPIRPSTEEKKITTNNPTRPIPSPRGHA